MALGDNGRKFCRATLAAQPKDRCTAAAKCRSRFNTQCTLLQMTNPSTERPTMQQTNLPSLAASFGCSVQGLCRQERRPGVPVTLQSATRKPCRLGSSELQAGPCAAAVVTIALFCLVQCGAVDIKHWLQLCSAVAGAAPVAAASIGCGDKASQASNASRDGSWGARDVSAALQGSCSATEVREMIGPTPRRFVAVCVRWLLGDLPATA